jgi:methionyl-tRNA formyltransferase
MSLRIAFIGSVRFSEAALQAVLENSGQVVGVLAGSGGHGNSDYADLEPLCRKSGLPCLKTDRIGEAETAFLREASPDVVFCFGWSRLLKAEILSLPRLGVVGFHPAALPKNRGRHPIIWALALGLEETASTFFFMDEGADSGDILSQQSVPISYEDEAQSLYQKITRTACGQIAEFLPRLANETFERRAQNATASNAWRKRSADDGRLDFRMGTRALYNLTRALTRPYPGAHVNWQGRPCPVWRLREAGSAPENLEPGKVLAVEAGRIRVKAYDGAVELLEHALDPAPQPGDCL